MARLSSPIVGPLRHAGSLALGIAGAESNVAIGLARLGVTVSWTGRVGDDEFGRLVTATLRGEGVETRPIIDAEAATGMLIKERRAMGHTGVSYYRRDSAGSRLRSDDLDADAIRAARVLHTTGITPALSESARDATRSAMQTARHAGTLVSLDLNIRKALWSASKARSILRELVSGADLVFATVREAAVLVDAHDELELARGLAELGAAEVVIKRGRDGALAMTADGVHEAPRFTVAERDPVGAGDAFAAGYLSEWLVDAPVPRRLETAARCGAFAVTVDGDWEGLPSRPDLVLLNPDEDVQR